MCGELGEGRTDDSGHGCGVAHDLVVREVEDGEARQHQAGTTLGVGRQLVA